MPALDPEASAADPSTWGVSAPEIETALERIWNLYGRDAFEEARDENHGLDRAKFRDEWLRDADLRGLELDSEWWFHDRFLRGVPEGVNAQDLLEAYFAGKLPRSKSAPPGPLALPERFDPVPGRFVGQPAGAGLDVREAWAAANARATARNRGEILRARYAVLVAANADKGLAERLGVPRATLTARLRSWSGFSAAAASLHDSLNAGVPEAARWSGLVNASFLGRATAEPLATPESFAEFFSPVQADPAKERHSQQAEPLRRYMLQAATALNFRVGWKDLGVKLDGAATTLRSAPGRPPRGIYADAERTMTINAVAPNTVAHEMGHYLDYKWARELVGLGGTALTYDAGFASRARPLGGAWARQFHALLADLADRADLTSEYTQDRGEVFARFFAAFVAWTHRQANRGWWEEPSARNDRFHDGDFRRFVKLMQQKQFVDASEPPQDFPLPAGRVSRRRRLAAALPADRPSR